MFIAMNRFKVIKEERKAFEDLWATRQSHLDEVNDFQAFHLLRYVRHEDRARFEAEGWRFAGGLGPPHGRWAVLMQAPEGFNGRRRNRAKPCWPA
jgi:hypothetical protein